MTSSPPAAPAARSDGPAPALRRVAAAALVGTTIEFYDFFIYGTAAALVFGKVFFPGLGAAGGLLAAFSVYAVAFLARPVGAVLFGHYGDRLGRKTTLVGSLLLMGVSTALVGLLPGYGAWGIWAPVLLVFLRFCQGIGLGGEWGGAALLLAEHAPPERRGRYGGYLQLGPCAGFFLANAVFLALSEGLSRSAFLSWGWRVPFLASAALVAFGLFVRLRVAESPMFREQPERARVPVVELLREHGRTVLLGGLSITVGYTLFYLTTTYALAYATGELGLASGLVLGLLLTGALVMAGTVWFSAGQGDRWGRRRTLVATTSLATGWALVLFPLLETARPVLVGVALIGAMAVLGLHFGPVAGYLPELFPTRLRYTGVALGYNLGGVVGGATAPLVATRLNSAYGTAVPIGWYAAGVGVVSLLSLLALPETRGRDLAAVRRPGLVAEPG
ncbi:MULTISPECIES: MFS transporter [unclassified Kitasatospora]|uniref:MFS transporter n=1 Tax=unclassified Kitasatospora TaxID=2633591 RepID=UPI00070AC8FD|nr:MULTISPECIES: MFS transporter [unclassified Kitasatospora]KQV23999.1 MFS transporter [Kitasatospora sp. Root107]KRB67287.1 MFS transporter [Kitasatospora sp. Root187]